MSETKSSIYLQVSIDRLAADVAAVKAKVDAVSPEDVRHFVDSEKAWVKLVEDQRDAAVRERDEARAEVERLRAELAARQADGNRQATLDSSPSAPQPAAPPAGWMTEEERHILSAHLQSLREQRRAMERGGQTLGYSANPCAIKREADVIDALLTRAGSPPVVVLPTMFQCSSLRDYLFSLQQFKDALDAAGVAWKEVGRE